MLQYFKTKAVPMASDPVFPIEIFPLILQHLQALESQSDLARCSLVCKTFRSICRKLLFQRVDLSDTTYHIPTRRYRLLQHFKRHPKLSKLIRHISYTPNGPAETADNEEALTAFLDLPLVQSLSVGSGSTSQNMGFMVKKRGAAFKFSVCSLICSYIAIGNLTSLSLIAISNIPLFSIITSPNLKYLSMKRCTYNSAEWATNEFKVEHTMFKLVAFRSINSNLPGFIHRCPQLRELEITSNSPIGLSRVTLPAFLCLQELTLDTHSLSRCFGGLKNSDASMRVDVKFPALHRLELHVGFTLDDYTYVRKMVNYIVRHSPRLNELSIQGPENIVLPTADLKEHIDLPTILPISRATLRKFEFRWHATLEEFNDTDPTFNQLIEGLDSFSLSHNVLRSFFLEVKMSEDYTSDLCEIGDGFLNPFRSWETLDLLLSRGGAFPRLQEVQVNVEAIVSKETFLHLERQHWDDPSTLVLRSLDKFFVARTRNVAIDAATWLTRLLHNSLRTVYEGPIFYSSTVVAFVSNK